MEEQTDKTFVKNMSIVLALLIVFTFTIIFLARDIGVKDDEGNNPSRQANVAERLKPVSGVYTGEDGAAAIQQAAATTTAEPSIAFEGSLDAEMLYTNVCSACHTTGAAGAPKLGSPEMALRAEKGLDALTQSAINGINAMPARGGRADLSDEQMQVVVEYMLK